jgi:cysteine desulfurase
MNNFEGKNVISSSIEHDSVLQPVSQYVHKIAPVDQKAVIDLDKLFDLIDDNTVLISIMYANNEVGSIQPIKSISQKIHDLRKQRLLSNNLTPLYLHVDASQAVNYLDLHHARLGIDLMSLNGGKIYGPKQTGVLFVKSGIILKSNILGGGQERNIRSGTENVPGAIGLAKALEIAQSTRKDEVIRLNELQSLFIKNITKSLPETIINGSLKNRLPNNIHLSFPGIDNERLLSILDDKKLYCAAGSACSASSNEPSHVLRAMGIDDDLARSSIRISLGRQTTKAEIEKAIKIIVGSIKEIS